MSYQFTIIVPIYNEKEGIQRLFEKLEDYISVASRKTNVILVDDGSSDGSRELIKQYCKDRKSVV